MNEQKIMQPQNSHKSNKLKWQFLACQHEVDIIFHQQFVKEQVKWIFACYHFSLSFLYFTLAIFFQLLPKITQNISCNFQKQNVRHLNHSDVLLTEDVFQSNICAMEHPIAWTDMMKIHDFAQQVISISRSITSKV